MFSINVNFVEVKVCPEVIFLENLFSLQLNQKMEAFLEKETYDSVCSLLESPFQHPKDRQCSSDMLAGGFEKGRGNMFTYFSWEELPVFRLH